MNKIYILFLCLCYAVSAIMANTYKNDKEVTSPTDANIFGHVVDKATGEHLPGITIILKGTTIGSVTDDSGHYMLKNLPEGEFTIEVSFVGFKTVTKKVTTGKGKTQELNFELEEDLISLEGVVVSANRNETKRRLAPTLVKVLSPTVFEKTNSTTLAQGLVFQPGVRVENDCQNCGYSQVRINGMEGKYTQILIDSRPIFSALAGVYGLEQIPANMIERVEVIRGGGSALFGSSAIAGTINIITKEPIRNSGSFGHTISNLDGSGAYDNNTTLNLSWVSSDNKMGAYIYGQNRYRSAWDSNGDGFSELPKLKNQTIGFVLADVKVDPEQKEVELHLSKEKIQVTDNSTISVDKKGNVQVAEIEIKSIDRKQHSEQEKEDEHLNMLSVPNGRRSSLILSDGTKVWINSGTVLQFPETFEKEKRVLYVNGEIYIEVAKHPQWPFYVKTNQMEVQVLGTSFGITAYDDEIFQTVVLKEGSVFVKNNQGNGQTIQPNQCLMVEKEEMTVKDVDVYDYISWIDGVLQFHEKSLQKVLNSLSRYYRVRFDCPMEIGQIKCSGNLVLFDDIDQVLQTLQRTLSISFSHRDEVIKIEYVHK